MLVVAGVRILQARCHLRFITDIVGFGRFHHNADRRLLSRGERAEVADHDRRAAATTLRGGCGHQRDLRGQRVGERHATGRRRAVVAHRQGVRQVCVDFHWVGRGRQRQGQISVAGDHRRVECRRTTLVGHQGDVSVGAIGVAAPTGEHRTGGRDGGQPNDRPARIYLGAIHTADDTRRATHRAVAGPGF